MGNCSKGMENETLFCHYTRSNILKGGGGGKFSRIYSVFRLLFAWRKLASEASFQKYATFETGASALWNKISPGLEKDGNGSQCLE